MLPLLSLAGFFCYCSMPVNLRHSICSVFFMACHTVFCIHQYIFNLMYQEEAACLLEFIQRYFIGINPKRGTKATLSKIFSKKTVKVEQTEGASVNPRVSTPEELH
ncbi:hypothetical protein CHARACLAT_006860 [Characodon lateralis]|uniref:Uncharacterized protein n=1 Tax=Characodon lateralis TaxID=208331 RepID=A0ABU7ESP8_9TELE|nr:hypothetical protein [Characodon lateralis]